VSLTSNGPARAQPFWIDTAFGPLFAWHDAPGGDARDAAVVLCRPFGYDAQCSQRAYRHLAARLRERGFHVLRFDYHGTGDSSGDDANEDRLSAWLGSVRAGMEWTRAKLGVAKVVLFGTGFGALIALEMASHEDVDALVLFAPPRSGRAWLREGRALQGIIDVSGGPKSSPRPDGREESAGFLLTRPTVEALCKLDPLARNFTARAVLVVARDDLPGREERLIAKLEARGVEATLSRVPGYGAMIQDDPHKAVVPDAAWSEVATWLSARYAVLPKGPAEGATFSRVATVRERQAAPDLREEALDMEGLFGILTEPVQTPALRSFPTILLHNIGANSHVGANRMYVRMARRWAALGFPVLRFDTTGLGDSPGTPATPENRVYSNTAKGDSLRAMDFLARARGAQRFVLMGLCSGAYVSFYSALDDERVVALVLMNILLFHWKEGDSVDVRKRDRVKSSHFYARAFFGTDVWTRLIRGKIDVSGVASGLLQRGWERARHAAARALLGESDVALGFRALIRRGTDVLLIFDANDGGRDVIDAHLGANVDRFRRADGFRLEVIGGADHTFSPVRSQEIILSLLTSHLTSLFAGERAPSLP
jgi:pimeloyl-ACP methyl ester carboxylesterase